MRVSRLVFAGAAACLACGTGTEQVGSRYVKSVMVVAARGATISVIANESGELAGTVLEVPRGALERDTRLTLELGFAPVLSRPDEAAGPAAIWGPAGTRFDPAAKMTLPLWPGCDVIGKELYVEIVQPDGQRVMVTPLEWSARPEGGTIAFVASSAVSYQAGARPATGAGPGAPPSGAVAPPAGATGSCPVPGTPGVPGTAQTPAPPTTP
jgi:hypothetical protein